MKFFDKHNVCFEEWGASKYIENLSKIKSLRKTYKHFPYLYSYDESEETEYHDAYLTAGDSLDAVVALYDGELVGISIGCPLLKGVTICSELLGTGLDHGKPYYFGDIIIAKDYWGNGLAKELYRRHLDLVATRGFSHVLALIVERDAGDPRAPKGFKKSSLWSDYKFKPTEYTTTYKWNTYTLSGEIKPEVHTLRAYSRETSELDKINSTNEQHEKIHI